MEEGNKILFKEESYKIIEARMKVHRTFGSGFLEAVYEEAMEKEFKNEKYHLKDRLNWRYFMGREIKQILQSRFLYVMMLLFWK